MLAVSVSGYCPFITCIHGRPPGPSSLTYRMALALPFMPEKYTRESTAQEAFRKEEKEKLVNMWIRNVSRFVIS